ncbi:MAG: hypothetical protein WBG30_11950, partial [Psychrilyobacter sp.]|uniref:hypothetical protein n=1 Tax=Psychrilyobacter sp. TaxID=2586924 RepID=UPI003C7440D2
LYRLEVKFMLIKNKSDPIIHIRSVLERKDFNSTEKVFMIVLLAKSNTLLEFSPTEYSKYLGVSRATIYSCINKLSNLKILKKHEKGYKYIVDCKLL